MPVIAVLAEAEVRDQQRIRPECVAELAQGPLHDAVVGPRLRAPGILLRWDAEEHEALDADLERSFRLARQRVERVLRLPRHRLDRLRLVDSFAHEQWVDEVGGRDPRLSDKPAECRPRP